jgi:uncharacterized protein (TIGR02246 family)
MRSLDILLAAALLAMPAAGENEPPNLRPVPKSAPRAESIASKAPSPPELAEIVQRDKDYVVAFNRGDPIGAASFYADDAEIVDADGTAAVGRSAIEKRLKGYFSANQGVQLDLKCESIRLAAPEVAIDTESTVTTNSANNVERAISTAIYVKRNGQWLISHLTEIPVQGTISPYSHLQELEWMVGAWKDNTPDVNVRTTCQWAKNKTFLSRSFAADIKDKIDLEGTEVLGWDPDEGHIRAWIFDSDGGFGESTWIRDGNRWLIQVRTTLADGRKASAQNTITYVDKDKYTWESTNRVIDGELKPSIDRIEIVRVKSD